MRSVRAPITPLRRLPIKVTPARGEDWCGYLDRVAAALHTSTRGLRQHLGIGPHGDVWVPSHRDHGITMLPATRTRLAGELAIDVAELASMQLQRYDATLLQFAPSVVAALDPFGAPDGRAAAGRNLWRAGWATYRPGQRGCRTCLAQGPTLWPLTWRVAWHVVCTEHDALIDTIADPPLPVEIDDELLVAQQRMLALTRGYDEPTRRPAWSFTCDVMAVIETRLHALRHSMTARPVSPTSIEMIELLPDALDWVTTARGMTIDLRPRWLPRTVSVPLAKRLADRHVVADDSPVRAAIERADTSGPRGRAALATVTLRDIRPSEPIVVATASMRRLPAAIPQAIPMDLYIGDLSDLLYPTPLRIGRMAASIACVSATENLIPWRAARLLGLPHRSAHPMRLIWQQLIEHGRDDQAWDAVAVTVEELARRGIDYPRRQRLARLPDTMSTVHTIAEATPERIAQRWLREYWAGEITDLPVGRNAAARAQRALDHLERDHGHRLRIALDAFERTEAAAS